MLNIRSARESEYGILTDIAIKSEAYWGYDSDYMNKFKSVYNVGKEFIRNNITAIIEENDKIVGFYGILTEKNETSLEYFFIESEYIGKGYGKLLWNYMIRNCKEVGIKEFTIVTSPQAKCFYVNMGAIHCGEVESLLKKGRMIPRLIYSVEK
ncbi:acetyltransferase (GNAT) family protein [Oxobacter pfennigii]|uniref:Acetyltransferase (GNAT) family protein n=1 Tax=Oxobacter pfennigii TaxID=36849 RepID=A0A0P8YGG8_9CLOT|nr:GNAT family N-acetyltransferase [Oxobacter pfennigii]KPU46132.1 acetyltransferase (GNAT) family protein [Oxobacter pfennigii]